MRYTAATRLLRWRIVGALVAAAIAGLPAARAQVPAQPQTAEAERETIRTALKDIGRIVAPDGIDEGRYEVLGGWKQWVAIRGQSRKAPLLLFLHGGPGDPVSGIAYTYQRPWEDFFTVVNWDQRGFGRSWGTAAEAAGLKGTLNVAQNVADGIELIERLRREFHQPKIILVGQSYGTVLALKIAKQSPDLLYAVVTQGLAANWLASPELVRQAMLKEATEKGDTAEIQRLKALGPVPDAHDTAAVLNWGAHFGKPIPDAHAWHNIAGPGDGWAFREEALKSISPDLSAADLAQQTAHIAADPVAARDRSMEAMASVLPFDAARDVGTRFDVPVVVMQGSFDWQTNRDLAKAYFDTICAPWKKWDEFPQAAHALNIEQPGLAVVALVNDVLPAVRGQTPAGAEACPKR